MMLLLYIYITYYNKIIFPQLPFRHRRSYRSFHSRVSSLRHSYEKSPRPAAAGPIPLARGEKNPRH